MTACILAVVSLAAWYDARWRRVPNWLTVSSAVAALAWHAAHGGDTFLASLGGLGFSLLILFPCFAVRGLGGGDVKLFAALGAAVTYRLVPSVLLLTTVLAIALGLALNLARGRLRQTLYVMAGLLPGARLSRAGLPTIDSPSAVLVPFTAAAALATWGVLLSEALR